MLRVRVPIGPIGADIYMYIYIYIRMYIFYDGIQHSIGQYVLKLAFCVVCVCVRVRRACPLHTILAILKIFRNFKIYVNLESKRGQILEKWLKWLRVRTSTSINTVCKIMPLVQLNRAGREQCVGLLNL